MTLFSFVFRLKFCLSLRAMALVLALVFTGAPLVSAGVLLQPTPDGGLQPRLSVDSAGNIHLLYFKKRLDSPRAREGNLFYRQYLPAENSFSQPVKVSSEAFNLQTFSIARASMAVDGEGRVHVIWYLPRAEQFMYARSNPDRSNFQPQQSMVVDRIEGVDAGADIAALGNRVAIVWGAGDLSKEYERTVFARLSDDYGASFGPETMVGNPDLGACACCSLATDFTDDSTLFVAYRSAINGVGRHTQLLSVDLANKGVSGASYGAVNELQEWEISACPLSTNDIATDQDEARWLVFETVARIVQKNLASDAPPSAVAEPLSKTRQKNPAVAFNSRGERLIVWGEGISHSRGGQLNMRMFNAADEAVDMGVIEDLEIPDYSFPAAANLPDDNFLVLY